MELSTIVVIFIFFVFIIYHNTDIKRIIIKLKKQKIMKKQYKHKKTGLIVTWCDILLRYEYPNEGHYYFPKEIIEDSEDWKLVKDIKLTYKILSVYNKDNNIYTTENAIDKTRFRRKNGIYDIVLNHLVKIYSVQRLSDNTIFVIGDKILYNKKEYTIKSFSPSDTALENCIADFIPEKNNPMIGCYLDGFEKKKNPLFITEDGVEIFEGDDSWGVTKNTFFYKGKYRWNDSSIYGSGKQVSDILFFSTEEAAKEYIKWNKPQYSLQQIKDCVNFDIEYDAQTHIKNRIIEQLIKLNK